MKAVKDIAMKAAKASSLEKGKVSEPGTALSKFKGVAKKVRDKLSNINKKTVEAKFRDTAWLTNCLENWQISATKARKEREGEGQKKNALTILEKPPMARDKIDLESIAAWIPSLQIPVLTDLSKDVILELAREFTITRYKEHDTIIKQWDEGNEFMILITGEVSIFIAQKKEDGLGRGVAICRGARSFGDNCFLKEENVKYIRCASVVANGDVLILRITSKASVDAYRKAKGISIDELFQKRKEKMTYLEQHYLFKEGWSLGSISSFAQCMIKKKVNKGKWIYRSGDRADKMYFVISGKVQLLTQKTGTEKKRSRRSFKMRQSDISNYIVLLTAGEGSTLGEEECIDNHLERKLSARASTASEVYEVARYHFCRYFNNDKLAMAKQVLKSRQKLREDIISGRKRLNTRVSRMPSRSQKTSKTRSPNFSIRPSAGFLQKSSSGTARLKISSRDKYSPRQPNPSSPSISRPRISSPGMLQPSHPNTSSPGSRPNVSPTYISSPSPRSPTTSVSRSSRPRSSQARLGDAKVKTNWNVSSQLQIPRHSGHHSYSNSPLNSPGAVRKISSPSSPNTPSSPAYIGPISENAGDDDRNASPFEVDYQGPMDFSMGEDFCEQVNEPLETEEQMEVTHIDVRQEGREQNFRDVFKKLSTKYRKGQTPIINASTGKVSKRPSLIKSLNLKSLNTKQYVKRRTNSPRFFASAADYHRSLVPRTREIQLAPRRSASYCFGSKPPLGPLRSPSSTGVVKARKNSGRNTKTPKYNFLSHQFDIKPRKAGLRGSLRRGRAMTRSASSTAPFAKARGMMVRN